MKKAFYEMQWPKDGLFIDCFTHEIMNYRYHWHPEEYELNVLLHGSQEFCRGAEITLLEEDDVLLTGPGIGHASFAQQANTRALVIHFSSAAFKPYVKKGFAYSFPDCFSTPDTRHEERYRKLRFYAAQIYMAASSSDPYAPLMAKGSTEMFLAELCRCFEPQIVKTVPEQNEQHEVIRRVLSWLEDHYAERVTLEDLAAYSQYNRTYVSTLFKNAIGTNFHEYLTRLRFQHALLDLACTSKSLTEVAMDNGFSDLKAFNLRFREILHRSPSQYRKQLLSGNVDLTNNGRKYVPASDEFVSRKLKSYLHLPEQACSETGGVPGEASLAVGIVGPVTEGLPEPDAHRDTGSGKARNTSETFG